MGLASDHEEAAPGARTRPGEVRAHSARLARTVRGTAGGGAGCQHRYRLGPGLGSVSS